MLKAILGSESVESTEESGSSSGCFATGGGSVVVVVDESCGVSGCNCGASGSSTECQALTYEKITARSRRSRSSKSNCSKSTRAMSQSSSNSIKSKHKSVSPGSFSCNALNVDFSSYTATHQWTKMLECAEFVGAK